MGELAFWFGWHRWEGRSMCGEDVYICGRARGNSMMGIVKLRCGGGILNFGYCTYCCKVRYFKYMYFDNAKE